MERIGHLDLVGGGAAAVAILPGDLSTCFRSKLNPPSHNLPSDSSTLFPVEIKSISDPFPPSILKMYLKKKKMIIYKRGD